MSCAFVVIVDSNRVTILLKMMAKLAVVQALNDDGSRWGCYSYWKMSKCSLKVIDWVSSKVLSYDVPAFASLLWLDGIHRVRSPIVVYNGSALYQSIWSFIILIYF